MMRQVMQQKSNVKLFVGVALFTKRIYVYQ